MADRPAALFQFAGHGFFKGGLALGGRLGGLDLRQGLGPPMQGREDDQQFPGPGDGHVQAALSAIAVQGAEVHRDLAGLVGAVGHREEDHVALVALHVLEVLHEDRFFDVPEPGLDLGMPDAGHLQQVLHQVLLGLVEGDHTDRVVLAQGIPQAGYHLGHDGLGLGSIGARAPALEEPAGHVAPVDPQVLDLGVGAGERVQAAVVVVVVGEGDQGLVAAAVMPGQGVTRHGRGLALVQDALGLFDVVLVRGVVLRVADAEEAGGRQLLGVAHHHDLAAPGDGSDGVPDRDLRGLIEDDQVVGRQARVQVLGHREGAHQHAGLQARQQVGKPLEELPAWQVPALLGQLAGQQVHLRAVHRRAHVAVRDPRRQAGHHGLLHQAQGLAIQLAEALDLALVLQAPELAQALVLGDDPGEPLLVEGAQEGRHQAGRLESSLLERLHQAGKPQAASLGAGGLPGRPVPQGGDPLRPGLQALPHPRQEPGLRGPGARLVDLQAPDQALPGLPPGLQGVQEGPQVPAGRTIRIQALFRLRRQAGQTGRHRLGLGRESFFRLQQVPAEALAPVQQAPDLRRVGLGLLPGLAQKDAGLRGHLPHPAVLGHHLQGRLQIPDHLGRLPQVAQGDLPQQPAGLPQLEEAEERVGLEALLEAAQEVLEGKFQKIRAIAPGEALPCLPAPEGMLDELLGPTPHLLPAWPGQEIQRR